MPVDQLPLIISQIWLNPTVGHRLGYLSTKVEDPAPTRSSSRPPPAKDLFVSVPSVSALLARRRVGFPTAFELLTSSNLYRFWLFAYQMKALFTRTSNLLKDSKSIHRWLKHRLYSNTPGGQLGGNRPRFCQQPHGRVCGDRDMPLQYAIHMSLDPNISQNWACRVNSLEIMSLAVRWGGSLDLRILESNGYTLQKAVRKLPIKYM